MMLSVSMMSRTRVPRAQRAKNALERHRSRSIARRRRRRPPPDVRVESHGDTARSRASFMDPRARASFSKNQEFLGAHAFVRIPRRDASRRARHGRCSGRVLRRALAREMAGTGVRAGGFHRARIARSTVERRRSCRWSRGVGVVRWDHRGEKRERESVVACVFVSGSVSGGWGDGGGDARGGGRWVRGFAGRRGSSRETRNEPRDAMERLTRSDSRAFDRRRVVYNLWTWSRRDYSWIRRDSTEASSIALRRFAPRRASGRFGRD